MPNAFDNMSIGDVTDPSDVANQFAGSTSGSTARDDLAGAASNQSPQPSFTQRLLSTLGKVGQSADDEVRVAVNGITNGQFDRMLGPAEVQKTQDAYNRLHPAIAATVHAGGTAMGLGLIGAAGGSGMLPAAGTGAAYTELGNIGTNKPVSQQATEAGESALTSAAMVPVAKAVANVGSRITAALPDWITGAKTPPVPTSSSMTDPTKLGGYTFISNADKAKAAKLSDLEEIQRVANIPGQPSIKSQTSNYLADPENWANLSDSEKAALKNVAGAGPLSGAATQHPYWLGHGVSSITEPFMIGESHENPLLAIMSGVGGVGTHVGAYFGAKQLQNQAVRSAFNEAKRVIGGTPSQAAPVTQWLKDSGPTALHRVLLGSVLNNSSPSQNAFDQ